MSGRSRPVVEVAAGRLEGVRTPDGVRAFKGVPYGATTAGAGRFRPPSPAVPGGGVRSAHANGPAAPQNDVRGIAPGSLWDDWLALNFPGHGSSSAGQATGEDCLVLNVWTAASAADERRPVMVWLHGGGYTAGSGAEEMVCGEHLARDCGVVVVTVNHRLGVLGFLELEELLGADCADAGAVGMLDLVAALAWVRENVAAFGGDPSNVTVFGESGGGGKVACLLAMPAASGLFGRAVIQSGTFACRRREDAADLTERLLAELGLTRRTARRLQDVTLERLLAAQARVAEPRPGSVPDGAPLLGIAPVAGTPALPLGPLEDPSSAWSARLPLLIGTTLDDASPLLMSDPEYPSLSDAAVRERVEAMFGAEADGILARCRSNWPSLSPPRQLARVMAERDFRAPAGHYAERRAAAGAGPVHMYLFAYETEVLGGLCGSGHMLDLPFVFRTVDRIPHAGRGADRCALQDVMSGAWAAFARGGTPSSAGLPAWPRYEPDRRRTVVVDGASVQVADDPWGESLRVLGRYPSTFA